MTTANSGEGAGGSVLVTGAAGGLGRAFALAFAAGGEHVVVADRDVAGAEATAELVRADGGEATAVRVDVTDLESAEAASAAAAEVGGGRIRVLINNAAIYATLRRAPFDDITMDEWDLVMNVNLKGPWVMARAVNPYLADGGRIVNLSSATVYSGSTQWAHYVASKAGVIGLTRVLAKELGPRGITVNAVAPGFTLTEASKSLVENAEAYGVDRAALGRATQPDDIVGTVLFLAGPSSAAITGQTIVIDGGRQFI